MTDILRRLRRCWCSMLSLYNHKTLHRQRDAVNPHNEPEIANYQFGMGKATVNRADIKFGCWCNIP